MSMTPDIDADQSMYRSVQCGKHEQQRGNRHGHPHLPGPVASESERLRGPTRRLPPQPRDAAAPGEERASPRPGYDTLPGRDGASTLWRLKGPWEGGGLSGLRGLEVGCLFSSRGRFFWHSAWPTRRGVRFAAQIFFFVLFFALVRLCCRSIQRVCLFSLMLGVAVGVKL